jgi:hypothetical protein
VIPNRKGDAQVSLFHLGTYISNNGVEECVR